MPFSLEAFFPFSFVIRWFQMSALEAFTRREASLSVVPSDAERQLVAKLCETCVASLADRRDRYCDQPILETYAIDVGWTSFIGDAVNERNRAAILICSFKQGGQKTLEAILSASSVAERAREVIAEAPPAGLPVVFVCDGVGPVGGTQVILNLVDALNDLGGISASVVHKFTGNYPHSFVSKAAPLPLAKGEIVNAVTDRLGWKRGAPGIVVATSWGTGDTVRAICERNPALTPVAFWQDREDLFERHDGKPAGAGEFSAYLAIRHRVAVSRWILESAEAEGLIGARESDAIRQVIWPAVDQAFTSQPPHERADSTDRPVRILAMWRPMTAVRRGMPRLAKLYDDLRTAYRGKKAGRVSLEVFGWSEGVPAGVVSHGHLTTAQVAALMREVDIVVEPSEFQGFGLPGMEAIACGAALVTTPCRGPQEYAQHGFNAIVADDHDSLLPAVRSLIDDPQALQLIQRGAAGTWPPVAWADRAREFSTVMHIAAGLAALGVDPTT